MDSVNGLAETWRDPGSEYDVLILATTSGTERWRSLSEQHCPKQPSLDTRPWRWHARDASSNRRARELERVCLSRVRASWSNPCQRRPCRTPPRRPQVCICACAPPLVGHCRWGSRGATTQAAVSGWLLNERHGRTTWRRLSTCPCATGRSWGGGRPGRPGRPAQAPQVRRQLDIGVELARVAETAGTCSRASSPIRRAGIKLDVPVLWKT